MKYWNCTSGAYGVMELHIWYLWSTGTALLVLIELHMWYNCYLRSTRTAYIVLMECINWISGTNAESSGNEHLVLMDYLNCPSGTFDGGRILKLHVWYSCSIWNSPLVPMLGITSGWMVLVCSHNLSRTIREDIKIRLFNSKKLRRCSGWSHLDNIHLWDSPAEGGTGQPLTRGLLQ